jgi:hypothetical protein
MVARDMVRRLRPLLGALAAAALATFAVVILVPTASADRPAGEHATITVAARTGMATSTGQQVPRSHPPLVPAVAIGVVLAATLALGHDSLVGRHRRRLGDVGDDWRSLLLGAPPATA